MIGRNRIADLRALARLLDAQRGTLRAADPAALDRQTAQIEALFQRLESAQTPGSAAEAALVRQIRSVALAGLRDLTATLAGLRDAQTLLQGARAAAETRTYGPLGERVALAPGPGRLERRS